MKSLLATRAICLAAVIFLASCGGSSQVSTGESQTKLLADSSSCGAVWSNSVAYNAGNSVSYDGKNYTANWWTQGNNPSTNNGVAGSGQPWTAGESCNSQACSAAWSSNAVYVAGNTVSYDGKNYTANWWTQGNTPSTANGVAGSGQPWTTGASCQAASTTTTTTTTTLAVPASRART